MKLRISKEPFTSSSNWALILYQWVSRVSRSIMSVTVSPEVMTEAWLMSSSA